MLPCYKDLVMAISLVLLMLVNGFLSENDGLKAKNDDPVECKTNYVEITQSITGLKLASGSPVYLVEIVNFCPRECSISQLHINCGSFSSELRIPPTKFRRVGDTNDCIVNDGESIGAVVSFQYASPQPFTLDVSSLQCS